MRKISLVIMALALLLYSVALSPAQEKGRAVIIKRPLGPAVYQPRVLGLFIGIQEFDDAYWHDLKYPRKDIQDLINFFSSNQTMQLDYKMILTEPEKTTRDYILNFALDDFALKNTSANDIVLVYFSGHGTLAKDYVQVIEHGSTKREVRLAPYIVAGNTREGKESTSAIPLDQVMEWFEKLPSQRKVLILDVCHSGLGKSQWSRETAREINSMKGVNYPPLEDSWASMILSACEMGASSFEDDDLKNSIYTHFLIEGMKQGDLNGDGGITISEAHNYAVEKTRSYSWQHKGCKQVPTAYSRILGKDPLLVYGSRSRLGMPVLFQYASANRGVDVYINKAFAGTLPGGIKGEIGEQLVECKRNGKTIYREKVKLQEGEDVMLPICEQEEEALTSDKAYRGVVLLEGGYQDYQSNQVPRSLTPSAGGAGCSVHYYGLGFPWLGVSGGFNFTPHRHMNQYSGHVGIKFSQVWNNRLQIAIGPDCLCSTFNYSDAQIDAYQVNRSMFFLSPGLETVLYYKFRELDWTLALGNRTYYINYQINERHEPLFSSQNYLGLGIPF